MQIEIGPRINLGFPADAIGPLVSLLEELDENDVYYEERERANLFFAREFDDGDFEEATQELVDELVGCLDELSPRYCYFGIATKSDAQVYGFFPDWENIQEAEEEGGIINVCLEQDIPKTYVGGALVLTAESEYIFLYRESEFDQWEECWRDNILDGMEIA